MNSPFNEAAINNFIEKMVQQGYNIEKYGTSPIDFTPEIVEKIVEVEVEVIKLTKNNVFEVYTEVFSKPDIYTLFTQHRDTKFPSTADLKHYAWRYLDGGRIVTLSDILLGIKCWLDGIEGEEIATKAQVAKTIMENKLT